MIQERQHEEGSQFMLVHDRQTDEQQQIVMVQERQVDEEQQQQVLMIQGHHDQPHQQYVIIQNRREPEQVLQYESSRCDEKQEPLSLPRQTLECEPQPSQIQVVTIGSENATLMNQPLYYNPAAFRTYPIEVQLILNLSFLSRLKYLFLLRHFTFKIRNYSIYSQMDQLEVFLAE